MGIQMKAGGIVLGGLAGYLIMSKAIQAASNCVKNICEARKWKNYYKYGKNWDAVPPGYEIRTTTTDKTEEGRSNASSDAVGSVLTSVFKKAVESFAEGVEAVKNASEGQTEASEEAFDDIPDETPQYDDCPKVVEDDYVENMSSFEKALHNYENTAKAVRTVVDSEPVSSNVVKAENTEDTES